MFALGGWLHCRGDGRWGGGVVGRVGERGRGGRRGVSPHLPGGPVVPPLIEICHVLVSPEIGVGEVEAVKAGGHPHLELIAWVRVE